MDNKKTYNTPNITKYGTVAELTQANADPNQNTDGGGQVNVYAS